MYTVFTLRLCNSTIVKAVLTISQDMTLVYVMFGGVSVMWPTATILTFKWMSSIFTSKFIWHLMNWCPTCIGSSFSCILKATWMFFIFFAMELLHKVLTFSFPSNKALSTVFGQSIPKFIVVFAYFFAPGCRNLVNDSILLPQHVLHPQIERRLLINLLHNQLLRRLQQVILF